MCWNGYLYNDPPRHPLSQGCTDVPYCREASIYLWTKSYFTISKIFCEKVDLMLTSKAVNKHSNTLPAASHPQITPRGVAVKHWYKIHVTLIPNESFGERTITTVVRVAREQP